MKNIHIIQNQNQIKRSRNVPTTSRERIQYYLDQCNTHKLSYLLDNDTLNIQDNGKVLCESCIFRLVGHKPARKTTRDDYTNGELNDGIKINSISDSCILYINF